MRSIIAYQSPPQRARAELHCDGIVLACAYNSVSFPALPLLLLPVLLFTHQEKGAFDRETRAADWRPHCNMCHLLV